MSATLESVKVVPLSSSETTSIRAAFGENGASLPEIKQQISATILPKICLALGWKRIRAVKGRVNDRRTVDLKYNSLWHRDRHIYLAAHHSPDIVRAACSQNLSAVVYLDPSRLDYIKGSAVPGEKAASQPVRLELEAGSIAVFPSCLIHRAVAHAESKQRRTIVLFDIENPDEPSPLPHDIITCPGWTQRPLLDGVFGEDNVEEQMLADLVANRPYLWRYYRRHEFRRVHWQVTTAVDDGAIADAATDIAYNRSFYLIDTSHPNAYPPHVRVYDHRGTVQYVVNLVRFHLGFGVL